MHPTRRNVLCLAIAGAVWPWGRALQARPFVDRSGLGPGRFIWNPTAAPRGPVVVIASLASNIAHIYRGGVRIGITTCTSGTAARTTPSGAFALLSRSRPPGAGNPQAGERLTWEAVPIQARGLDGYPARAGLVRLPRELAELLLAELPLGSTLIVSRERSLASEVVHPGAFWPGSAEGRRRRVAESVETHPVHSVHDARLTYPVVAIVVSATDRKAYLLRDGALQGEAAIAIREPRRPLGEHVYALTGLTADRSNLRWLAVGIGDRPSDRHVAESLAEDSLARVAFDDPQRALDFAQALHLGSMLVVSDNPGPVGARGAAGSVVGLASELPLRVGAEQESRDKQRLPIPERSAAGRPRAPKRDADETFPFTMYWPYDG